MYKFCALVRVKRVLPCGQIRPLYDLVFHMGDFLKLFKTVNMSLKATSISI